MDELTLLRRLNADAPPASPEATNAAFDALMRSMEAAEQGSPRHAPTRRRTRARRTAWALTSVGLGAALTLALVVTDVVGVAGLRPGASAQAAELLNRAAANAITTTDPGVGPGQYLLVRTDRLNTVTTANAAGRDIAYAVRETGWLFIPKNEHDVWTEVRTPGYSVAYYGKGAKQVAEQQDRQTRGEAPEIVRGTDGTQWGGQPQYTPSSLAGLPRDPRILLNHIYRVTLGAGQSRDGEALVWIADLLRTGFVPAELRAALYRAATLIPGVTVADSAATLNGRRGVAIGRIEGSTGIRQDLIIDPDTGLLIGEREVTTRPIDTFSAGVSIDWTAVSTRVVRSVDPSIWARRS